jgi:Right handed beta helix region
MKATNGFAPSVVLAVLLASPAAGATLCVNPSGTGGCQATIQAAVDLAAPGDTILIGKGLYYENVVVGSGKDGLKIVGASRRAAVLDGSPFADRGITGGDITLLVAAPDVRIRGLGFRNGMIGILVGHDGATLEGLDFRGTDFPVIVAFGARAQVLSSAFRDAVALNVAGPDFVARGNLFERTYSSIVFQNLAAPNAQIVGNGLESVRGGLDVRHNIDTVVRDNVLRHSGGLTVSGLNPIVEGNVLFQGSGIDVECGGINLEAGPGDDVPPDCTRASVSSNRVAEATQGMLVGASEPGTMPVRDNVLSRTWGGLVVRGAPDLAAPLLVERNRVLTAGLTSTAPFFRPEACFTVAGGSRPGALGTGATLRANVATRCAGPGFDIRASGDLLEANRVREAGGSGFFVSGVQFDGVTPTALNELRGNKATFNAAQGIAVGLGALDTRVIDNEATGNRTDFCDEGIDTSVSGNAFGTTSATCGIPQ